MAKTKYPPPYTKLNAEELKIYTRIWERVSDIIGTDDVDNFIITMAAQKLHLAASAMDKIKKDEKGLPVQEFENGTRQVSPFYTIYKAQTMEAAQLLEKAGLTPKARKEHIKEVEETAPDPMAILLGLTNKDKEQKTVN